MTFVYAIAIIMRPKPSTIANSNKYKIAGCPEPKIKYAVTHANEISVAVGIPQPLATSANVTSDGYKLIDER